MKKIIGKVEVHTIVGLSYEFDDDMESYFENEDEIRYRCTEKKKDIRIEKKNTVFIIEHFKGEFKRR